LLIARDCCVVVADFVEVAPEGDNGAGVAQGVGVGWT
jgi:hypothetical protein